MPSILLWDKNSRVLKELLDDYEAIKNMIRRTIPHIALLIMLAIACLTYGCGDSSPILIGFSGQLTGKQSDLGVYGRNGAILAVEKINSMGGINGRPLKLLIKDDKNTVAGAIEADKALINEGAVAIIGHMTSSQTMGVIPMIDEKGIVLVSPTTATPELSNKADSFFRIMVENTLQSRELADYARSALDIQSVVTISESDNSSFALTFNDSFIWTFQEMGGNILKNLTYSGSQTADWDPLIDTLLELNPDAVLLTCPAQDAVSISQRIRNAGLKTRILSAGWAYTDKLLQWGGRHVEGMLFVIDYAADNPNPGFIKFRESYKNRFGTAPNFASAFSYEAVLALAEGLKITNGLSQGLADAMAPSNTIKGIISDFRLNEYGDVNRNVFIVTVQEGEFRTVEMR